MYPAKMSTITWTFSILFLVAICVQAIPDPAPEESSTFEEDEEPEVQSTSVQSGQSSVGEGESGGSASAPVSVSKPKFVCNPRCAGYAEEYQVKKFIADKCCTFIPCPQTNTDPTGYARFRKRVCSRVSKCN